mmetsp:Transcript_73220/g.191937  ORF Transcript_73220/g.191937 Transcript_73220/m.191937 type:complete len:313 (-) Transcript_73220:68-1006(-)
MPIVLLWHQHSLFRLHELRRSPAVRANRRRAAGHALNEDHTERLFVGGEHAHLGHGEELCEHILSLGANKEGPLQADLLCEALVLRNSFGRSAAHDHRGQVRKGLLVHRSRVEHSVQALPVRKLTHEGHDLLDGSQLACVRLPHVLPQILDGGASWLEDLLIHADAREEELGLRVVREAVRELADVVHRVHPDARALLVTVEDTMVLAERQEAQGVLRIALILLDVHLQSSAVDEVEVLQLCLTLLPATLQDLGPGHGVGEGMVRDQVVELLALLQLDLIHVLADLVLQAQAVCCELLVVHGVPPVRGVGAD